MAFVTHLTARRALLSATVAAAALLVPLAARADDNTVTADIVQFAYQPTDLQITAGTTVVWTNHDAIVHSVTAGTPAAASDAFDSGLFDQDGTFSFTFAEPGQYTYFCSRHNFMQGSVTVG